MEQKREFTGVWIPREIVEDERLNWSERALYAEISCYKECFASNAFFASRIGVSEDRIKRMISKLKELGYIEQIRFDGRSRWLTTTGLTGRKQPSRRGENNRSDGVKTTPIDNNIDKSIDNNINSETSVSQVYKENNKSLSLEKSNGGEVNEVISYFQELNPLYEELYKNKTQRKAVETLIKKIGKEKIQSTIQYLKINESEKFIPRITKPTEMIEKLPHLIMFFKKKQSLTEVQINNKSKIAFH